jgi:hypothetical protein
MKKLTCFVVMVFLASFLFGQVTDVKWGKPFPKGPIVSNFRILGMDDGGMSLVTPTPAFMKASTSISVLRFDGNMNYLSLTKFALKYQDLALSYEFTVPMKGRTLIFSSYVDGKAQTMSLFYNEFDDASFSLSSKTVKVTEMPIIKAPMPIPGSFDFTVSPDSNLLALVYTPPNAPDGLEKFGFVVLDKDLNTMYQRNETFPFKDRKFHLGSIAVNQTGKVFLCGYLTTGAKNPFRKEPNYKYVVSMVDKEMATPLSVDISLDKRFIPDLNITCDLDGDLVASGFYSNDGEFSIKGAVSVIINGETGVIEKQSTKDFTIEFITAGMKEKQADRVEAKAQKGKNVELENYYLDCLLLRPDNGVYLVAERRYTVTTTTTNSNGSTSTRTTYYAEDIIVIGMDETGEIDLVQKVLKKQKSSTPANISYTMGIKGSSLYFVFIDNALNNAPNPPYTSWATLGKNGVTTVARIDANGELVRKKLYSFDQIKFVLWPAGGEIYKNGELLLVTIKGSKAQLGLLTLEE